MTSKKQIEKHQERNKLREMQSITITIAATEGNLQRIAALLLFADHLEPEVKFKPTLLPWEDPNDPQYQKPPELEIDYEAVKRSIAKNLLAVSERFGVLRAKEILATAEATGLSAVKQGDLVELNASLECALAEK